MLCNFPLYLTYDFINLRSKTDSPKSTNLLCHLPISIKYILVLKIKNQIIIYLETV